MAVASLQPGSKPARPKANVQPGNEHLLTEISAHRLIEQEAYEPSGPEVLT